MVQKLHSNKLKVDFVTIDTATRGKGHLKEEQTEESDHNSLLSSLEASHEVRHKNKQSFQQAFRDTLSRAALPTILRTGTKGIKTGLTSAKEKL